MSLEFTKHILKIVVAQINQTIGWNSIQSTPLEILVSLLQRYLEEVAKLTHRYAEQFGHTEPNLDDLGLAFMDMGININELEEYVRNVDSVPFMHEIPLYPLPKESHLNHLKPGSREVVTRPVHVHEHLPPMYPEMEDEEYAPKQSPLSVDVNSSGAGSPQSSPKPVFKRPGDPAPIECPALKRARWIMEEEGRPMREISSVMMTTSGFLSPAREGKLPESRTPMPASDSRSNSPQPSSYPLVPPEVKGEKKLKKNSMKLSENSSSEKEIKKKGQKIKDKLNKTSGNKKKLLGMKEITKLKALKTLKGVNHFPNSAILKNKNSSGKTSPNKFQMSPKSNKISTPKTIKLEKVESPTQNHPAEPIDSLDEKESLSFDGKLSTEPDKQKLNIFKKISKVKEDKSDKLGEKSTNENNENIRGSRESTPGLVIDESDNKKEERMAQITECIESVIQKNAVPQKTQNENKAENSQWTTSSTQDTNVNNSPNNNNILSYSLDDMSLPGTPATPRTPELPQTPSITTPEPKERKRKNKSKSKKENKNKLKGISPKKIKNKDELLFEENIMDRPKTPEAMISPPEMVQSNPVFPFFQCPLGLIPPPLGNPLFPSFSSLQNKLGTHSMGNLPIPSPIFMQPNKSPSPSTSQPDHSPKAEPNSQKDVISNQTISSVEPNELNNSSLNPKLQMHSSIKIDKGNVSVLSLSPKEKIFEKDKKSKEHKKEKKEKDKSKKKKDKKDKMKNKEKGEKKKLKLEKKEKAEKNKLKLEKKEKKEKKKEREWDANDTTGIGRDSNQQQPVPEIKREEKSEHIPKITLRLGPASPKPNSPEPLKKIVIKPIMKKGEESVADRSNTITSSSSPCVENTKREPSPELARISALIIRPPKNKLPSKPMAAAAGGGNSLDDDILAASAVFEPPTPVETSPLPPQQPLLSSTSPLHVIPKIKTGGLKLKAKDIGKKPNSDDPPSESNKVAYYYDKDGNKVWICPGCGGQDDGSPMIGCDDCDAWYHWVCVGIQVPPDENEDWYCKVCIVKKKENAQDKKKKSRKKKC